MIFPLFSVEASRAYALTNETVAGDREFAIFHEECPGVSAAVAELANICVGSVREVFLN